MESPIELREPGIEPDSAERPRPTPPTRLTLNINAEAGEALVYLQETKGFTYTESIRRSLLVLQFFTEKQAAGTRIELVDKDGTRREVVLV